MPSTDRNPLSPKKLLRSKWTAVTPQDREKHFIVVHVVAPTTDGEPVREVQLEAVHSGRITTLAWRTLTDAGQWRQGWL